MTNYYGTKPLFRPIQMTISFLFSNKIFNTYKEQNQTLYQSKDAKTYFERQISTVW